MTRLQTLPYNTLKTDYSIYHIYLDEFLLRRQDPYMKHSNSDVSSVDIAKVISQMQDGPLSQTSGGRGLVGH